MPENEHILPYNLDAEKSFLCACLLENKIIRAASVKSSDFYHSKHGQIWATMQELSVQNEPVDIITITDKEKGIAGAVADINAYGYPTASNWAAHEKIILETSSKRQVIHLLHESLETVNDGSIDKIVHDLRMALSNIARRKSAGIVPYKEIIAKTFDMIESRMNSDSGLSGITTGFKDMDILTDGYQPGELIILGGRPSMGKTALAKAGSTAAAKQGVRVGMIHLEMGDLQLGVRAVASQANIAITRLRRGLVSQNERSAYIDACSKLYDLPIFLDFSSFTDREIARAIDNLVFDKGVQIIYLDYLQLAISESSDKNREQEVSGVSRMLKLKAKEHQIPIVALAQLNRQCEMRTDKRPILSDLRDSGGIEQDADVVAFIYRDEFYNPTSLDKGIAEIIFRKGRQIELDTIKVQWDGPTTTYHDLAQHRGGQKP